MHVICLSLPMLLLLLVCHLVSGPAGYTTSWGVVNSILIRCAGTALAMNHVTGHVALRVSRCVRRVRLRSRRRIRRRLSSRVFQGWRDKVLQGA